ncbi:hypothetical protein DFH28DRAFT_923682 [Melampsora americana]|nr:hypothetical protein DFH28DRAFT_923682 [Melampsora americana]
MAQTHSSQPLDECFVEKTRGAEIPLYHCIACPGDRSLQLESIKRHRRLPSHKKNYERWLARQNTASNFMSFIDDPIPDVQADTVESRHQIDEFAEVESDPDNADWAQRRQALVDLWTKNHSRLFASPTASVHSSEGPEDDDRHPSDTETCRGDDDQSHSSDNCTPKGHPLNDVNDASWYPFSSLEELANPYVMDHLEFIPTLPNSNCKINCLVQSKKWREGLDRNLRVQMVSSPNGHFFLYEPAQLYSQKIVIPIFFYKMDNEVLANSNHFGISEMRGGDFMEVPLKNPWRAKADGKIIRHMPLVLYCDDLSGNISKRWNKHIAYYFTLAGLPPKLANQEYNCHFLTTSNTAGALELGDPLVDEINDISTNGFVAYDHQLETEVLVMTVVLCHLGDSPMHAEITNTLNPSSSLSPCRICKLQAKSMIEKRSTKYIEDFVGIDEDGRQKSLPVRTWSDTKELTEHLWDLAQRPGTIGLFDETSSKLGVKDTLNMFFVKRIQDFYREPNLSNADVAELCGRLNEEFGDRLFNPFLRLKGDLNGKEFRTVIQAAPFIFFECNLSSEERDVWTSLAHLGPYLFQTEISDMQSYLKSCNRLIRIFLRSIVRLSAQWCNKPKFHMLIHICDSIERFGPACLFATEKFESYNGNTRFSSIHSNHLSPGRDIANSFNNLRLMRSLTAGSHLYDTCARTYICASAKVINIFKTNTVFQRALGYNSLWNCPRDFKNGSQPSTLVFVNVYRTDSTLIFLGVAKIQPEQTIDCIPKHIFDAHDAQDWKVLVGVTLKDAQKVHEKDFISVLERRNLDGKMIGRVKRVWGVGGCGENQCQIELSRCKVGRDIQGVINVQHNCHDSQCDVQQVHQVVIERKASKYLEHCVVHVDTGKFIINSASFHSAELHRAWAQIPFVDVQPEEWVTAVKEGIDNWEETLNQKQEATNKKRQKAKEKFERNSATKKIRNSNDQTFPNQTQEPVAGPSTEGQFVRD